jgi:hypothetical protein
LTINITGVIVRLVQQLEGWFQWPQCGEQPTIYIWIHSIYGSVFSPNIKAGEFT